MKINVENKLIECLKNIGIECDDSEDVNLQNYINDSLQYIAFIAEIENQFDVEFPDELLGIQALTSLKGFAIVIEQLLQQKAHPEVK